MGDRLVCLELEFLHAVQSVGRGAPGVGVGSNVRALSFADKKFDSFKYQNVNHQTARESEMSQRLMPAGPRSYTEQLTEWPQFNQPTKDPELGPLRRQSMAIISSILEDPSPEGAGIRTRLRGLLAQNVGCPEKALLEHLQSLFGDLEDPEADPA